MLAPCRSPVPGSTTARRAALRARAEAEQKQQAQGAPATSRLRDGAIASTPAVRRPPSSDRYGGDALSVSPHRAGPGAIRPESVHAPVTPGPVIEGRQIGSVGAAVAVEKSGSQHVAVLEDRHGVRRGFALRPDLWIEGRPVILDPPVAHKRKPIRAMSAAGRRLMASSSYAVEGERAKVARVLRIWVEGKYGAELVEEVWGNGLCHEGVVVLMLGGIDSLEEIMADFGPASERWAGVLVDRLVAGSKGSRTARWVSEMPSGENMPVPGHPYVDVRQAVKPARVGLEHWPDIPRGADIKHGTLEALGQSYATQAGIARGWQRTLATVRSYKDFEPSLLGRVGELIDFATAPGIY